jgi:hypothetical protein
MDKDGRIGSRGLMRDNGERTGDFENRRLANPQKIFILQTDWFVIFPIFANQSVCYGKESG